MSMMNAISEIISDKRQQIKSTLMTSADPHFINAVRKSVMMSTAANNTLVALKIMAR